jgi:catechol 2,3-dioxygenase-like lactoylglutathione lyase family enzyme
LETPVLTRLFHIAINAKDLGRSVEFYQRLGFTVLSERTVGNPKLSEAFAVPSRECRFVHLRLGGDEQATVLDIVEWFSPATADGAGTPAQNARGLTRFAVLTDDTDKVYEQLKEAGAEFITTPTTVMTPQGGWRVCLVTDPDGVVVQITQLMPAPAAS